MRTVGVNTDIVAGDGVAGRAAPIDPDTTPSVARDYVSLARGAAPDGVVLSCIADFDSIPSVS